MPPASDTIPVIGRDFLYLAPVLVLIGWGLLVLIVDLVLYRLRPETIQTSRRRSLTMGGLSLLGVGLSLLLTVRSLPDRLGRAYDDPDPILFGSTIAWDMGTTAMALLVLTLLGLVVSLSMGREFTRHRGEYYALVFWAAAGMIVLIAAEELITLFVALEAMTLCLYLLTAFNKSSRRSPEAGLKYFIYGSVSSALFLYGLSFLYGMTGATRLDVIPQVLVNPTQPYPGLALDPTGALTVLLILVGLGFKIAAVPFHQWAPDAYDGAPTPIAAWIASGSKVASFIAMLKVFGMALAPWATTGQDHLLGPGWIGLLAVMAAVTMTFGNLAALWQKSLKRMLAYSAIAHAGYLLVGVTAIAARTQTENREAVGAVLFYLVVYGVTKVAAFAVAAWTVRDRGSDRIDQLNGLAYQSPALAVCIGLIMLSLIGIPPLGGFFGKLYLFMEALDANEAGRISLTWLVAIGLLNTVISAFYYIRVLRAIFMRPVAERPLRPAASGVSLSIAFGTLVALVTGILPAPLLDSMQSAGISILSVSSRQTPVRLGSPLIDPRELPPEEEPVNQRIEIPIGAGGG